MGHMYDYGMMGFGVIPVIMLIIWLAFLCVGIYLLFLIIKALKVYIKKNS